ncbi:DUF7373 family lipoprotein [Nocardia stercoris]|nr:hypothetical protein [Nocardia stercoris]
MWARAASVAVILATALSATSCGTHTAGTARPAEPDVRTLDVGQYSTDPLDLRSTYYPTYLDAKELAVARLADQVLTGEEIDPKLKFGLGSKAVTEGYDTSVDPAALDDNGLMFGFASAATDRESDRYGGTPHDGLGATLLVMQFPTADNAATAAAQIDERGFAGAAGSQHLQLADYPAAHSYWNPDTPTLHSTVAHGQYVVSLVVQQPTADPAALTRMAATAYAAQLPKLDALAPLTPEQILRLPFDPDRMLLRTLNPDGFTIPSFTDRISGEPAGLLHQSRDRDYWQHLLAREGVDRFALTSLQTRAILLRSRDSASADRLAEEIVHHGYPGDTAPPPGVPTAKCGEKKPDDDDYHTKRFRCTVSYRQYVAWLDSDQLQDVHQQAAAQYALLANSQ